MLPTMRLIQSAQPPTDSMLAHIRIPSSPQPQHVCTAKPKVAAFELPWVSGRKFQYLAGSAKSKWRVEDAWPRMLQDTLSNISGTTDVIMNSSIAKQVNATVGGHMRKEIALQRLHFLQFIEFRNHCFHPLLKSLVHNVCCRPEVFTKSRDLFDISVQHFVNSACAQLFGLFQHLGISFLLFGCFRGGFKE